MLVVMFRYTRNDSHQTVSVAQPPIFYVQSDYSYLLDGTGL